MTRQLRIERAEALVWLVGHLAGDEFGGTPACAESDPELFFPVSELHTAQIQQAKRVCAGCPVAASCLRQALEFGEHGVWGGTTEDERRRLRAARRREQQQEQGQGGEFSEEVQAA